MRLLHLANHTSRNIGNAALILGLERVLREDVEHELAFEPEPWAEGRFDESFVDRVNAADALLVGAAVAFDGRDVYRNTGFRFDVPPELLPRIRRPIVFYGLSHRDWPGRPYHHRDRLRRTIETLLGQENVLFSVRNDGTKPWLERMIGFASDRIHVVPDPAVYVPHEDSRHPELEPRTNVIVAPNGEDNLHRWGAFPRRRADTALRRVRGRPAAWQERRTRFVRGLAAALGSLARDRSANLILAVHMLGDEDMCYELLYLMPDDLRERAHVASLTYPVSRGPYVYDLYAKADLALSMRVHSMTPAIGLGTPVVPLVSQPRMADFMADAGLADICVDVSEPEAIDEAAARALDRPDELRTRLRRAYEGLRARTAAFNERVAALLAG
jgi:polysaccharide pyruvyl transferase WcaK-like protein